MAPSSLAGRRDARLPGAGVPVWGARGAGGGRGGELATPSWSAAKVSVCGRGGGGGALAGIPARDLTGASAAGLASAVTTGSAGVASRGKKLAVLVPVGAAFVRQMRATASETG